MPGIGRSSVFVHLPAMDCVFLGKPSGLWLGKGAKMGGRLRSLKLFLGACATGWRPRVCTFSQGAKDGRTAQ